MRNPVYEQALSNESIPYEYRESVSLQDIDVGKGLRNQARLENPLDKELAAEYGRHYKAGDKFPPVVLWRPGKGRWIPADGNHRLEGLRLAGNRDTDAYLLETTDLQVVERLSWRFNNLVNGRRNTPAECLQHALTMVRKYGWTARNAAKEWGLAEGAVARLVRIEDTKDVLRGRGLKITPAVTDAHLEKLHCLNAAGEDVLTAAATVVANSGIDTTQTEELVRRVRNAKDHDAKVKAVDDFAKEEFVRQKAAETSGGKRSQTGRYKLPRQKLQEQLRALLDTLDGPGDRKAAFAMSKDEWKATRKIALEISVLLNEVFGFGAVPREEVG